MTSLVVQLPPRDGAASPADWQLPALPFAYFDGSGRLLRQGTASADQLPVADDLVLILAASDVLLLCAIIPPVPAQKLRQALPNVVEDQLLQDAARCHFAVGDDSDANGRRIVAVVDRAWMRFIVQRFGAADGRRMRAVPLSLCLPAGDEEHSQATLIEGPWPDRGQVEVAMSDGGLPYGVALPRETLAASLAGLARGRPVRRARLALGPGGETQAAPLEGLTELDFESVASLAISAVPDLCQFEFAPQRWQGLRSNVVRWRVPIGLALACLAISIVAINIQWFTLARDYDSQAMRAEALLREAFPKTTVVQDAPLQMTRNLEALRTTAGELAPGDFLTLCARLGDATGTLAPGSIAALDYSERTLTATFRNGAAPDASVIDALRHAGLSVQTKGDKWVIRGDSQ